MFTKIVYLAGFMATGKSTIGPILANTLGWNFYDLDELIESKYNSDIGVLFNENGEDKFRIIEKEVLFELNPNQNAVIALGGGTMLNQQNIDFMKKKGIIVLLESTESNIYYRIKNKKNRPLFLTKGGDIIDEKELRNKIRSLLKQRKIFYKQADIKINNTDERVGTTVDRLAKIIISKFKDAEKN